MQQNDNQITIIVAGPNASGKTAILTAIAEMLVNDARFRDVKIGTPEERPHVMYEKMAALMTGDMDQVLGNPVVLYETDPLTVPQEEGGRAFQGYLRLTLGYHFLTWSDKNDPSMDGIGRKISLDPRRVEEAQVEAVDLPLNPKLADATNNVLDGDGQSRMNEIAKDIDSTPKSKRS